MSKAGAISGLKVEQRIIDKFNKMDADARAWATLLTNDKTVQVIQAYKPATQIKTDIFLESLTSLGKLNKTISVKSVKSKVGSNQLTRFWTSLLVDKFGLENDLANILKRFTGEASWNGNRENLKREKLSAHPEHKVERLKEFFYENKYDLIKWMFTGDENIDHFMVVTNVGTALPSYFIYPMQEVISYYSAGDAVITSRGWGGIKIGRVSIQRKGGDKGKFSACQLQSKIRVGELSLDYKDK